MTNTRITDPEVLERRYPVVLCRFSLRPSSGGRGLRRGGDGIEREILFRKSLTLSVLTERRVFAPYGLHGGHAGAKGLNLLQRRNGILLNLGSKCSVNVEPGVSTAPSRLTPRITVSCNAALFCLIETLDRTASNYSRLAPEDTVVKKT